jgi:hypothetical protein
MAITLSDSTPVNQGVEGNLRFKVWRVAGPSSYSTGGTSFTPAEVGMSRLAYCEACSSFYDGTTMVQPHLPPVSSDGSQLLLFNETAATVDNPHKQVTAAANLSSYIGLIKVYGT